MLEFTPHSPLPSLQTVATRITRALQAPQMHPAVSPGQRRREFKGQQAQGRGRRERNLEKSKCSSGEEWPKINANLTTPTALEICMEVQTKTLHTQLRLSPSRWDSASRTDPACRHWSLLGSCGGHRKVPPLGRGIPKSCCSPSTPWEPFDGNAALKPLQSHNKSANSRTHEGQKIKLQCCTTAQD